MPINPSESAPKSAKPGLKLAVKAPVLPAKTASPLAELDLADDTEYGDFLLEGQNLIGQSYERVLIERAWFKLVRCSALNLAKSRLSDIRFDACDLSNMELQDTKFARVEIVDCKVTGMHIIDGDIGDFRFKNCIGELVQFHGSSFKRTLFENCQLKGADFRYCNLEGCVFKDCDLQEAEFYEAKLAGTDFRSCNIMGIKAHPPDLKGAIIDSDQAAQLGRHFATILGIEVQE